MVCRPERGDDQLDRVHGAGADLHLLGRVVLDQLLAVDPGDESRSNASTPSSRSTWGTRLSANIVSRPRSSKRGGAGAVQVGGGDLGALEERQLEPAVAASRRRSIPAASRLAKRGRRAAGGVDTAANAAGVSRRAPRSRASAQTAPSARDLGPGRGPRDLGRRRVAVSSPRVHGPCASLALAQMRRDRAVAADARRACAASEPPGAEVDRVERQPAGGDVARGVGWTGPAGCEPGCSTRTARPRTARSRRAVSERCAAWRNRRAGAAKLVHRARMTRRGPSGANANVAGRR